YPRVHAATAADLDPALAGAGTAGLVGVAHGGAAAHETLHVHLGRGLGEGEVGSAEARAQPFTEDGADEGVDGAAQVGQGDAPVHDQAFELVEDRSVRGVELVGTEG